MFNLFQNTNTAVGLSPSARFQQGISNVDDLGISAESKIKLPYIKDSVASYFYYDVHISCYLDSGIVVHRHLPQSNPIADSLGGIDFASPTIDKVTSFGVNTKSVDSFTDTVQRMAHSIYRFCLRGEAIRASYQVPIPKIVTICGVPAIPDDADNQKAYNKVVANYSGVPVFYAAWELWYTVAVPPEEQQTPPANLGEHIRGDAVLPDSIQGPWSQPDSVAQKAQPKTTLNLQNPVQG